MSEPRIRMVQPDDWHLHLRDGPVLQRVLPVSARVFARAIVMPNLDPPVTTVARAAAYRDRILAALPVGRAFEPLMTLYLTERTTADEIARAADSGFVHAIKYYPAGATTNADAGVRRLERVYPVFEAMQARGMPLLLHGEVTDPDVDVFDREAVFIERHLQPLIRSFPGLRMVLEHVTTREAVEFVRSAPDNVGATITAHHLLLNRNAMFAGGLRPHHYCRPLLKRELHRRALLEAATSGHARFFLGTDSAPHPRHAKQSACGCAGVFSAPAAIELYAEAFEAAGALDRLEAFASLHGPDFYGLPRNPGCIELERIAWRVPRQYGAGAGGIVPLRAGARVAWRIAGAGPAQAPAGHPA